jgi:cytochrome c biogenesis protein CcmG/thiol:disulfide interchange protein DsbE
MLLLQVTAVVLVAGLLALLLWRVVVRENGSRFVSDIAAGKRPSAPAFRLPVIWAEARYWPPRLRRALADGQVSLGELRGYTLVLNFWASWCPPCRDEAPALAAAARSHTGRVVFLGIDSQDLTSDARRFLRRYQVPYVSVRDGSGSAYEDYGVTGLPETYYLDSRGRAIAHSPGAVDGDSAEEGVRAALRG